MLRGWGRGWKGRGGEGRGGGGRGKGLERRSSDFVWLWHKTLLK